MKAVHRGLVRLPTRVRAAAVVHQPPLTPSRPKSAQALPRTMAVKYQQWTKEALVRRIDVLERALAAAERGEASSPALPHKKKVQAIPEAGKYATRFIALKMAYLGRRYGGFEFQPSGSETTIEEELWKALVKACLVYPAEGVSADVVDFMRCEYSKCGRTDRGVSAFGQVVALRVKSKRRRRGWEEVVKEEEKKGEEVDVAGVKAAVESVEGPEGSAEAEFDGRMVEEEDPNHPDDDVTGEDPADEINYANVLNRLLPPDIRILAWCPTPPPGFSARFSCRERQYRYYFTQPAFFPADGSTDPAAEGWLDLEAMRDAAARFVGLHDFRNFCKVDASKQISSFTRRVFAAEICAVPDVHSSLGCLASADGTDGTGGSPDARPLVYSFNVRGSAFLWHQIRHMVAILFLVGQRRESPDIVSRLLDIEAEPRRPAYELAAEAPLVLWDCIFPTTTTADGQTVVSPAEAPIPTGAGWTDGLQWRTVADEEPRRRVFVDGLWRGWRAAKMDEILANRLLDAVTSPWLTGPDHTGLAFSCPGPARGKFYAFLGGDGPRLAGRYQPLLARERLPTPADINDRYARQKGFADSNEMRQTGNWRAVIKARRAEEAQGTGETEEAEE